METINTTLKAIKTEWLNCYIEQKFQEYGYCPECGKFSKLDEFTIQERMEENFSNIHGDVVLFSDKVRCYICPKCKKVAEKKLIDSHFKDVL